MSDEKKPLPNLAEPPSVDEDDSSLAADDPTAVWDVEELMKAGMDEVLEKPESKPPGPATEGEGGDGPSIVTEDAVEAAPATPVPLAPAAQAAPAVAAPRTPVPAPAAQPAEEMGWGATLALAAGLGAVVYVLIRFLR